MKGIAQPARNSRFSEAAPGWPSKGIRWRWALEQIPRAVPDDRTVVPMRRADFLHSQFGVHTISGSIPAGPTDGPSEEPGPFAVHTLGEDETIAQLATGIKRFPLPDEHNFITLYRQVAESGEEVGWTRLASIFENRRQYPQAADCWRRVIEEHGPGGNGKSHEKRLEQIVGPWGRFENVALQEAGQPAAVENCFRNGQKVRFEAHAIKVEQLLDDVKALLRTAPRRVDGLSVDVENIGYHLVVQKQTQYLGERVAQWETELDPPKNHWDGRITVETPLKKAGAYLLTAHMPGGNTSRIVLWLEETAIVHKPLDKANWYFVADAVTGRPVAGADVEFFGWRQERVRDNRFQVFTTAFRQTTNADGEVIPDPQTIPEHHQWLVTARTKDGRFAYLGFDHVWYGHSDDPEYNQTKVLALTDRPVYRPDQMVKFKLWVRQASYTQGDVSRFANQTFTLRITDPKGNAVLERSYQTDQYGGFDGEYKLPDDAPLGPYGLMIVDHPQVRGGGSFRVEEYKKPEFEVTIEAPDKPVRLGETVTATIKARYYFGAPVTHATVRYKVQRTEHSGTWYPPGRWDWFYGPGYWWFGVDRPWYPGWERWGLGRPTPSWWHAPHNPPELVLENEVPIGPGGTVKIEIDTALAQAVHGESNHRYEITAEVVDQSRRTIVGQGEVLVAKEPFQVFAWVDRGFYRTGDTIEARFQAQTLDRRPVEGEGTLTLYRVTYSRSRSPSGTSEVNDAESGPARRAGPTVTETPVETWDLDTDARGEATVKIEAAEPGQYRLSYQLTGPQEHAIEGGYVFQVIGEGQDPAEYRFNDLELIVEKREYARGETCRLLINTERPNSTVLLFVRPTNGVYPRPIILHLNGRSATYDIEVQQRDMPNFFIEAMTIGGAELHVETREVVVPPEQRVVNVDVLPSQQEYQPGEQAKVRLRLTDRDGNAVTGSAVMTVYDKSLEYIAGGPNVPDIREYFWKWQRSHYPGTDSNLARVFGNLVPSGEIEMGHLGAFGWIATTALTLDVAQRRRGGGFGEAMTMAAAGTPVGEPGPGPGVLRMADAMALPAPQTPPGGEAGPPLVQPTVRTEFADTAFWAASLTPDKNGEVEVAFTMPENLTTWKIRTWTMGHGTRVGQGEAEILTTKNLLVRLQAPRFFTETDEVVLSCLVHNYLDREKQATVALELEGETLAPLDDQEIRRTVTIPAGGETRVDWRVRAVRPGEAVVRMKALTDEESDAMQMTFPVLVHGILKTESFTGTVRQNEPAGGVSLTVPQQRRIGETRLEVRFSPTLAGAMVDALPYLVGYPYGCTEQTLNRFLPTVITQNVLKRMDLDLKAIRDKRTNLNPQEAGDPQERAAQWQHFSDQNPVFDEAEVQKMVRAGIERLADMQLADGGWGWFSGWGAHADAHTTALVVHGLLIARENGVEFDPNMLQRGIAWLTAYQAGQVELLRHAEQEKHDVRSKIHADNLDAFVFMVLVEAQRGAMEGGRVRAAGDGPAERSNTRGPGLRKASDPATHPAAMQPMMDDYLYRDRTHLSVYAKALYGLALHQLGRQDRLAMILRNIEQFLVQDAENETAYLKLPNEGRWWFWHGDDIEANACYLKLLSRTDPRGVTAPRLVKYLLNNRKHATYWDSTRDTAFAIESLAEYLRTSGEERPDLTVEVWLDGQKRKEVRITSENLFTFDNSFVLEGDAVAAGPHRLELRRKGDGPLYWNAYLSYFSLEDFITKAGLEIKVGRRYYKLVPQKKTIKVEGARGQAARQRVEKHERIALSNLDAIRSGDLVEIELAIDSKNDYEHLMLIDHKAAGFEPVELQSGYTADGPSAFVEYRDESVNFFLRHLPRGTHSLSYRLRAEVPGRFSALPTLAAGMYAPELQGNSDEMKVIIEDRPEPRE